MARRLRGREDDLGCDRIRVPRESADLCRSSEVERIPKTSPRWETIALGHLSGRDRDVAKDTDPPARETDADVDDGQARGSSSRRDDRRIRGTPRTPDPDAQRLPGKLQSAGRRRKPPPEFPAN